MSTDTLNPQAGANRPLPKKEADLFKNVVKHYETKQYKKAVKHAETILKKFPNHGETLAMKGLTFNYMNKREEAHALVKEGLMNDMRSHVCWHVYGLLYRSDRNYNEAIKAYKQALKIDPANLQILRDLSMLQIQMRDMEGFLSTRNTLLIQKPYAKVNWMAFSLARHLTGDFEGATSVIDSYLGTLSEDSPELGKSFESGELAMYKNLVISEVPNNYQAALDHLLSCENVVVDRGAWLLKQAEYNLKLKNFADVKRIIFEMFQRGMTENHQVHSLYMCAMLELDGAVCDEAMQLKGTQTLATMMPLTDSQVSTVRKAYEDELLGMFPKSYAIQRIPTSLMQGEELKSALDLRCRRDLRRGVPSLCSELYSFLWIEKDGRYVRPEDPVDIRRHPVFSMVAAIVDGYVDSLATSSKFSSSDDEEEPPSSILWAWFLRAGLHELAAEYKQGLVEIEKCLAHTPTLVDAYEVKARLLAAAGDIDAAVECLDQGRDLDRQDRYINNQTTKYMLRAGREKDALKLISMFTRHEGNPEQNLYEMQCSWYEVEVAACFARNKDWGKSLKKYAAILKHFEDIHEDQFDFHTYCLRKVTLRSYVDTLRFEDKVFGHSYFHAAAAGSIRIYLHLSDNPSSIDEGEPDYSKMTAGERKKAKAIARKKKKANEKKEEEEKQAESNKGSAKSGKASFIDEDPQGKELLKKNPLEEARKLSSILSKNAPCEIDTWLLQYDIAVRRKKPLLALQALHNGRSLDPLSGEVYSRIVDFAQQVHTFENLPHPVAAILSEGTPLLLCKKSLVDFVKASLEEVQHDDDSPLPLRVAVARSLLSTGCGSVLDAATLIVPKGINGRRVSLEACKDAANALKEFGSQADGLKNEWSLLVKTKFHLLKEE